MSVETPEARIAKQRVMNATRVAVNHGPEIARVGTEGALTYALLDIANAVRSGQDEKTKNLLRIADLLTDAITDRDAERIERLANDFKMMREGLDFDQHLGFGA